MTKFQLIDTLLRKETGKGDHRHSKDQEEQYQFTDVETLLADFLADIEKARRR